MDDVLDTGAAPRRGCGGARPGRPLPRHGPDAAAHRRLVPFAGTEIPVLGPIELGVFKARFDRTKDWADIEAMLGAGTVTVDELRAALAPLVPRGDERLAQLDRAWAQVEREP